MMRHRERLNDAEARFNQLTGQMTDPAVIGDSDQYRKVSKAQSELGEVVAQYREWKRIDQELTDARAMLQESDPDLRQMAEAEVVRLEPELAQIEEDIEILLLPKDPNDEKNVVLEIRKGAGGDEASLFAYEVFRMYTRYAEEQGWRVEVTSLSESSVGGLSEVIALVSGRRVYSRL
jgi:peptide chain release factor 1